MDEFRVVAGEMIRDLLDKGDKWEYKLIGGGGSESPLGAIESLPTQSSKGGPEFRLAGHGPPQLEVL